MDARERLRRYLEQRRELGESELVLDALPVDDVMKMLGARNRARASTSAERSGAAMPPPSATAANERPVPAPVDPAQAAPVPAPTPPPVPVMRHIDAPLVTDWRAALGNAGGIPPAKPVTTPDAASAAPAGAISQAGAQQRAEPTASPAASTDAATPQWLRQLDVQIGLHTGKESLRGHATRLDLAIAELPSLDAIATATETCTRCPLHATAMRAVPGEGNPSADFVCVGEAPGQSEDEQGRPFVGPAGQLLTKILGAIKLTRDDVFICNVLKHRPPGNRDPMPDEVHACAPYLLRQLDLLQPRVILALGSFAARTLLGTDQTIGRLRGRVHVYHGIPLIATYHPAALLRNEAWKRPAWEDVQLARRVLDAARAAAPTISG